MTARFRCPECNQPLVNRHGDDPTKGCVLKCPECGARMVVPPSLASFPRPQLDKSIAPTADDSSHTPQPRPAVTGLIAESAPWLMSAFFHIALAMIFMFMAMIVLPDAPADPGLTPNVIQNDDRNTGFTPVAVSTPKTQQTRKPKHRGQNGSDTTMRKVLADNPVTEDLIGPAAPLGLDIKDPTALIGPPGPRTIFREDPPPPISGPLPDVVYLIDRSGSMVDTFDAVAREMLMSIGGMAPARKFHVVLFSDGRPIEKTPRAMTPASDKAKRNIVEFLKPIRPAGRTDPIPAINRAFDVLARGSAGKAAVIHLLTDGVFPDNQAVLHVIRRRNPAGRIVINTILYGNRPPAAEKVMARIASENRGKYRFISRDE